MLLVRQKSTVCVCRPLQCIQVAHLGITEGDWASLAASAAADLQLPEATAAYRHLRDEQGLALMSATQTALASGASTDACKARILSYQVSRF
jgi:hypothetical protein